MIRKATKCFRLEFAKLQPGVHYSELPMTIYTGPGPADGVNFTHQFLGETLEYGPLFAYLFRRFGYPNSGWDDYKELVRYHLSTPHPDLILGIVPSVGNSTGLSIRFLIRREAGKAIDDYKRKDHRAHQQRMYDWIESTGALPAWMPDCVAEVAGAFQLPSASWRDVFPYLSFLGGDLAEGEKKDWSEWSESIQEQYAAIEPVPANRYRTANYEEWPEDDPLKACVRAAKLALADLNRPVRVRDRAIDVRGTVDNPVRVIKESAVAGYPSGNLGNQAPVEFAELHDLIMNLGKGNAKRGIAKVMAAANACK